MGVLSTAGIGVSIVRVSESEFPLDGLSIVLSDIRVGDSTPLDVGGDSRRFTVEFE